MEKINASFYDDGIPEEGSHCICLSVLLIDLVFKVSKDCYPQVFSKKCKYTVGIKWWLDILLIT